jgi:xanthine dehydrogenase YagT iron-sulfur-binding subunit
MDEQEPTPELKALVVTRRTVIETGTTALLLTALPNAALAAHSMTTGRHRPL